MFQRVAEFERERGAQEHVHAEFNDSAGKFFRRGRTQSDFSPAGFPAVAAGDHQQTRRRVEDGRHALLPNGNSYRHAEAERNERASREKMRANGKFR